MGSIDSFASSLMVIHQEIHAGIYCYLLLYTIIPMHNISIFLPCMHWMKTKTVDGPMTITHTQCFFAIIFFNFSIKYEWLLYMMMIKMTKKAKKP